MNSYYEESINKAVAYIKQNLDQKISLNDIAEAAGLSRFHFHRIFLSYTGDSIYDTVIRLRIERAAAILLTNSAVSISTLALSTGFDDSASFRKTFKSRFSISPSAWRKQKDTERSLLKIQDYPLFEREDNNKNRMKPISTQIKKLEGFSIAYIRHSGAYSGDSALFIYLYNKLTAWAASENLLGPEQQNVVVYHDPIKITEESKAKISLGISVPEDTNTNSEIGKMKLQGGDYIISRFSLRDNEYGSAWKQIYRQELPQQNLLPADGFCFELYPNNIKSDDKYRNIVDIYVPVRKL